MLEREFTITTAKLVEVEFTVTAKSEEEALQEVGTTIPCDHEEVGCFYQHGDIVIEERTLCCECPEPATHCLIENTQASLDPGVEEITLFLCEDCSKEYTGFSELLQLT